ncbi:hypothetical protein ACE6H2_019470 [Prunus campanulata]
MSKSKSQQIGVAKRAASTVGSGARGIDENARDEGHVARDDCVCDELCQLAERKLGKVKGSSTPVNQMIIKLMTED